MYNHYQFNYPARISRASFFSFNYTINYKLAKLFKR